MPRKKSSKKPKARKKPKMSVKVESVRDYIFHNVPEEHSFAVQDGSYIRNLHELAEALYKMEDSVFEFHSNALKNDFNNWVWEVVKDEKLALELVGKNRIDSAVAVYKHLVNKLK